MPRSRKHRILSRTVESGIANATVVRTPPPPFSMPPKTEEDRLYDLIFNESVAGYRFADNEYGEPWIARGDVQKAGDGIFVIRFRCPVERMEELYFWGMAKDVCVKLGCELNVVHETRNEYGLPYEECAWVIQKPIRDEEECPSEEEIDRRIEETLENFV